MKLPGRQGGGQESEAQILALLAASEAALGAYAIARRISLATGRRRHANTIYRALDKLMAAGRIVPVVSLKAYMIASEGMGGQAVILLCSGCGTIAQQPAGGLSERLFRLARAQGFRPRRVHLELWGRCRMCRPGADRAMSSP